MVEGRGATGLHGMLAIVVPLRDEERTLLSLVTALRTFATRVDAPVRIVLVDDGSTDGTPALLSRISGPDITVLRPPSAMGQHRAVLCGMGCALQFPEVAMIATMDADMDPPPEELAVMLSSAEEADLVVGRRIGRRRSPIRWIVSLVLRACCAILRSSPIHDHGSMFRLYTRSVAQRCVELSSLGPCIPGLCLLAARRPVEVGVRSRTSRRSSRYTLFGIGRVAVDMMALLVRARLHRPVLAPRGRRS